MALSFTRKSRASNWIKPSLKARISWIELDPHHKSGKAGVRFAQYHGAKTVEAYLERGGTWDDLKYDIDHHLLGILKPEADHAEPAAQVNPAPIVPNPNRIAGPPSGIYIVTLNNSELISNQAHDRRYDGKAVLMVNHQHVKFGSAIHLTGRMEYGYYQTFGQHNVNFIPVVATHQYQVLENGLKELFRSWRLRSPAGVLTEWTAGIDAQVMIEMILATAIELKIPHSVIRRTV